MKRTRLTLFAALLGISLAGFAEGDAIRYVDPLIGSGGHGHVFVGASVPFSALQLGPQNIYQGWDWCSGYYYGDPLLIGFSHSHLSGTGCADLGDVIFMPYTGKLRTACQARDPQNAIATTFSHADEVAQPGYYAVKMDNGVSVELTAAAHTGMHHYTYPAEGPSRLVINLHDGTGSISYESAIRKVDDYTVEGYRFARGWAPKRKVFFYAKFDQPIAECRTFAIDDAQGFDELQSNGVKAVLTFGSDVKELKAKVATSSVSCTNARMNMEAEIPAWDFAEVKTAAQDAWNKQLGCVTIEGTDRQKTIFYTALYHTFICPNQFCDVNGDFRGMDDKVYTGNTFTNYTTLSLWDTYRQLQPMFTILAPDIVDDLVNTMLSICDQNGKLPIWPLQGGETNCMPGYSSVPVIADAYLKGFRGYDAEKALRQMVQTATNPRQHGVPEFMQYGYIPAEAFGESTSYCLEYAADDWGLALMAKAMGKQDIYDTFIRRGHAYEHYWDGAIRKCHPKMADGTWCTPYDPFLANHDHVGDFTEGNGWEYTFMVPQDPDGLVRLHGSDEAFIENLDSLFIAEGDLGPGAPPDVSGMIGQYAHGNEPNHHIPYLYAYAGAQWKTAARVRQLQESQYTDQPDGYCGNEDAGQMSAWHVMSALGFYQVNPSNGIFVMGSPLFKKATLKLPEGRTLVINAPKNSDKNIYIQSVRLNGKPYPNAFLTYEDIMKGGTLTFNMGPKPNKNFGKAPANRPVSAR